MFWSIKYRILWFWMNWPQENSIMAFWFRRTMSLEIKQEPYWNKIKKELLVHSILWNCLTYFKALMVSKFNITIILSFTPICNNLSHKQIREFFKIFKPSIVDSHVNENDFNARNHMNMMARRGIYFYHGSLATQNLTKTSAIIKWHAIHFETELLW